MSEKAEKKEVVIIDHEGNRFPTIGKMAKFHGLSYFVVYNRLKEGWSIERALTTPVRESTAYEYKGIKYNSLHELCRKNGVSSSVVRIELGRGKRLEDVLDRLVSVKYRKDAGSVRDSITKQYIKLENNPKFNGKEYNPLDELCSEFGIGLSFFRRKFFYGWRIEDIISGVLTEHVESTITINKTSSINLDELCRQNKLDRAEIREAIYVGKDIIRTIEHGNKKECERVDHLGNYYKTAYRICLAWGIRVDDYYKELKEGTPIEDILTRNTSKHRKLAVDHKGNQFVSLSEMASH